MSISPRFLEEMKNRLTLSDIIGRRVKVTRAGREFKACCPFHHEKSPSFTINDDKQFYHCFGCGAHGDVIGFVMQHDNLDFMHAVEMLASEAGMQMPKPDPRAVEQAKKSKSLYNVMDDAARWMQDQLAKPEHKDVRDYLDQRGISPQSRDIFRIGYAPGDGQALRRFLKGKDYTDAMMIEAGLLKPSTKGGEPYIFFRDRIMVPVTDRRGQVVAFGGRILPEHIRPQKGDFKPPKYINTADTPLFDKGRMLFAESQARHAAREGHSIIVTEGYMDVIACHQAGFKGAVAPMGTALTEDQAVLLWSMIPSDEKLPTLCFDGDNAGRSAASRACERILPLLQPGQSVQFAFLPDGEDPDSLLKSGGAGALKSVLHAAMPLFDFLWLSRVAGRNLESPEMRAGLEKSLHNEIAKIKDADVQRYYRGLLRDKISQTFYPRPQSGKP
ncbi:MAG: DNA primase, partial [Bdellovibrionales bacterium]